MFRQLTDQVFVSPQISLAEVAEAAAQGVTLIINNRPEDESDDQVPGAEIETAARAAGMDYAAIPVTHAGFSQWQMEAMAKALGSEWPGAGLLSFGHEIDLAVGAGRGKPGPQSRRVGGASSCGRL